MNPSKTCISPLLKPAASISDKHEGEKFNFVIAPPAFDEEADDDDDVEDADDVELTGVGLERGAPFAFVSFADKSVFVTDLFCKSRVFKLDANVLTSKQVDINDLYTFLSIKFRISLGDYHK